jgi:hypothetical protein
MKIGVGVSKKQMLKVAVTVLKPCRRGWGGVDEV